MNLKKVILAIFGIKVNKPEVIIKESKAINTIAKGIVEKKPTQSKVESKKDNDKNTYHRNRKVKQTNKQ